MYLLKICTEFDVSNFTIALKKTALALFVVTTISQVNVANADDQVMALQKSLLSMQNQMSDLQEQLANSDGKIEELEHMNALLVKENKELKAKLAATPAPQEQEQDVTTDNADKKVVMDDKVSGSTATLAPAKVTVAKVQPKQTGPLLNQPDDAAKKLYQSSYDMLNKGNYDLAANGFKSFTTKYPDNALTSNAWYWLGQVQYKQKKYEKARLSFLQTAKFKGSSKRADALYKLGITSKALGDTEKAKKFFEVVIKTYPTSSSTALAKKELESMK